MAGGVFYAALEFKSAVHRVALEIAAGAASVEGQDFPVDFVAAVALKEDSDNLVGVVGIGQRGCAAHLQADDPANLAY